MVTSHKCEGSKKPTTYSIHQFWKQDLPVNKALPNFSDDLNVNKSPSVSKSSTFNIIADNFSSHDNNFLKLTALSNALFLNLPILILFLSQHLSLNIFFWIFTIPSTVPSSKIKCCLTSSTGVQGETLISNSTSYSNITSKCISSTVPVTNLSCNINFDKNHILYYVQTLQVNIFYLQFLK